MNNISMNKLAPYLISIAVFFVFTTIYFSPEVFDGKTLNQSDYVQFQGMAKRALEYRKEYGKLPLWNDAMFCGMPDYQMTSSPSPKPLVKVHRNLMMMSWVFDKDGSGLMFLMMLCFWAAMLAYGVNPWLAMAGGVAFSLGTYNIINIEVGHVTKVSAIAYGALILGGLRLLFDNKLLLGAALTAFGLSMQILMYHYQITFYLLLVCIILAVSELIRAIRANALKAYIIQISIVALCGTIAVGSDIGKILMTQEYAPYSMRGGRELTPQQKSQEANQDAKEGLTKEYAFAWSQGITESMTLLIPNFVGSSSTASIQEDSEMAKLYQMSGQSATGQAAPYYWGGQPFTAGPLYAGAVVVFLFVFAMLTLETKHRWWMLGGVILSLMLAWGKNFAVLNYFLFDYIPLFNKFRSVSMALALGLTIMPMASIMALDKVLKSQAGERESLLRHLLIAAGVTGGLVLMVLIGSGLMSFTSGPQELAQYVNQLGEDVGQRFYRALIADRKAMLRADAFRSLVLIGLAFGSIYLYLKDVIKSKWILMGVCVLMIGDLLLVSRRQITTDSFKDQPVKQTMRQTPADTKILQDKDPHYRVLDIQNPFNEARTAYFHKSVGGYSPAKLQRFQDLIERQINPEIGQFITDIQSGRLNFPEYHVLNMLNTKYLKAGGRENDVFTNLANLGDAWFVQEVQQTNSADEEMAALGQINTARQAVVDITKYQVGKTSFAIDPAQKPSIKLTDYNNRYLKYEYNSTQEGFVVFSEVFYPKGWKVTIDNEPAEMIRANYILRAMEVPAGKHTIEMTFDPWSASFGYPIAQIFGWILMVGFFGVIGYKGYVSFKDHNGEITHHQSPPVSPEESAEQQPSTASKPASKKPLPKKKKKK